MSARRPWASGARRGVIAAPRGMVRKERACTAPILALPVLSIKTRRGMSSRADRARRSSAPFEGLVREARDLRSSWAGNSLVRALDQEVLRFLASLDRQAP